MIAPVGADRDEDHRGFLDTCDDVEAEIARKTAAELPDNGLL